MNLNDPNILRAMHRPQTVQHRPGCQCHFCTKKAAPAPAALPLNVSSPQRLDFFMPMEPPECTSQMKGERIATGSDGRQFVAHFKRPKIRKAEAMIRSALAPYAPSAPFVGPLKLVTEWTWTWRASESKRNRAAGWRYRDTMPDFDNISKLLVDQMAELKFFTNDSQIALATVVKMWGDRPGIRITLEGLQQP